MRLPIVFSRPVMVAFMLALLSPAALPAQTATMITSLVATQGETLTYTVVITNGTASALTGVVFGDVLDPNTTFVDGSVNTSPLALPDVYSVLGNVQITSTTSVLANDVDVDGVGPALTVTATNKTSVNGGNVSILANGNFTYNPPPGFEGTDTFTYTLNDGEGFTDTGTVSLNVSGMIWFVTTSGPVGDGRLTSPFNSLNALAFINNGTGTNPAAGDNIFLYSDNYTGPLTLLNNQKLIGQGATASLATITGLTPPPGSLALPATGGARSTIAGSAGGVTLASANTVRGLNLNCSGGTALSGANVGVLAVTEAAVTNTAGGAVNLANGTLTVALGSVSAAGGANGIRLVNCTGSFTVSGDGALARNGSGGTIQNCTGNGIHLDTAVNVSLARMNINNCQASGLFGQNLNGLVVDWCSLDTNGDAVDESGIRIGDPVSGANGLVGSAPAGANPTRIANTQIRASGEMNVAIFNNGGTLTRLDVTNVVSRDTRTRPLGADGFLFEVRGAGNATLNFNGCNFTNNFTQGIQASALAQSVLSVTITSCGFTNNNEGVVLANANDADLIYDLDANRFFNNLATGGSGAAISAVNATTVTSAAIYSGKIRNNTINGGGIDNHLVAVLLAGSGLNTIQIANNTINAANSQFSGIFLQAGETGSGNLSANATVTGNIVSVGTLGSHGIVVQSRITSTLCAELASNVSTTGGVGLFGLNVRQRDTSTFRLPTFAGPFNSTAAVATFLQGKNPGTTIGSTVATAYTGGGACTLPLLAMPRESQRDSVLQPRVARDELPWESDRERTTTPTGLRQSTPSGRNPVGVGSASDRTPRVGAARQPWAEGHNPFGIEAEAPLTDVSLLPILAAARQRWAATGLTADQLAIVDSLQFEVTSLNGWYLGASSNRVVRLDRRANGHGWFIDPTPLDDREFAATSETRLSSVAPSGRIDLLSAVLHEMGHTLGLPDDYAPAARDNVMYGFLIPGERRLPRLAQARDASPDTGLATHYLFTPINIGTLPAGKSITITFRATVANPLPPGICVLTNQGTISGANFATFLTDDPRTVAAQDATLTAVLVAPLVTTQPATTVTDTSATLNGTINPCGTISTWFFQYGTTTNYGAATAPIVVPAGNAPLIVNAPVSGLLAGATYHFRLVGTNTYGSRSGADLAFTTPLFIVQQPANAAACVGGTANLSVTPSSLTGVTYQWQRRLLGQILFSLIPGATNQFYITPPLAAADDAASYRVVVSSPATNLTSSEALLAVIALASPTVTYDFNSGLPLDTAIYGNAFLSSGVLELNANIGSQSGAFLTTDLAPGRVVRGFATTFKARLLPGSSPPADGFSFNWATDLPNGTYAFGEEGQGSGLRVGFDTFDNGGGEAPAIDVWWGNNLVARRSVTADFLARGPNFVDVQIRLTPDGLLDLTYGCESIFARLPVTGYTPQMTARFGLGSRTGGLAETHGIDDLALELYLDPTNGLPRITSLKTNGAGGLLLTGTGTPTQNYSLEASTNLTSWIWRTNVATSADGVWQFLEPVISTPRSRFYRLRAAPQFPPGLVTWYRAENNLRDSFGPNHGATSNNLGFVAGQRAQAFNFDGTNSSINIGAVAIPPPWTAALWVKRLQSPDFSSAILSDSVQALKLEQAGSLTRAVGFTRYGVLDYVFNYTAPSNAWVHLTFVGTSSNTVLYTDGVAQDTNAASINLPLGFLSRTGGDRLKGQLDEVTLFNRALTPAEIQQVRNATRGP